MTPTSVQEALWVLRAQCGDREALELLLRSLQPSLHRYLTGLLDASRSDDVLQDVLVRIYRKLGGLRTPELVRPWAFRIASRIAFRVLRRGAEAERREARDALDDILASPPADPQRVPDLLAVHGISAGARAVLTLHFQEGLSLAEVAEVLELPLGTVKSRLAYGLARLRERMPIRRNR